MQLTTSLKTLSFPFFRAAGPLRGYASSSVLMQEHSTLRNLKQMEEERKLCWWNNGCVFAFFVIYPLVTPASSFFRLFLPRMQRTLFVVKTGMGLPV